MPDFSGEGSPRLDATIEPVEPEMLLQAIGDVTVAIGEEAEVMVRARELHRQAEQLKTGARKHRDEQFDAAANTLSRAAMAHSVPPLDLIAGYFDLSTLTSRPKHQLPHRTELPDRETVLHVFEATKAGEPIVTCENEFEPVGFVVDEPELRFALNKQHDLSGIVRIMVRTDADRTREVRVKLEQVPRLWVGAVAIQAAVDGVTYLDYSYTFTHGDGRAYHTRQKLRRLHAVAAVLNSERQIIDTTSLDAELEKAAEADRVSQRAVARRRRAAHGLRPRTRRIGQHHED